MKTKTIALIFGGQSMEHEVSIESAKSVYSAFKNIKKYKPFLIHINKKGHWLACDKNFFSNKKFIGSIGVDFSKGLLLKGKKINIDGAFSLIHGNTGEDGKLQGFLELMNIPYTGCSVMSSAVSMDKKLCKKLAKINGLPVLKDILITKHCYEVKKTKILEKSKQLGYPLFVKPNTLGSSVGVFKVKNQKELESAIKKALKFDREILIEKGVEKAREIVCGVLGGWKNQKASPCGEVRVKGKHEFFDYSAKYTDDNGMDLIIPADIKKNSARKIQSYSLAVFKAIKGYGLSRIDFFINPKKENEIYFCEINSIPGFTSHSLYPRLWGKAGLKQEKLVEKLIDLAFEKKNF